MRVLYFTRDYTPHDHRFLSALSEMDFEVFSLRLERRGMQREDRPLPPAVQQIVWKGGTSEVDVRDYPHILGSLQKVIDEVKPDVIHAGPIQSCAFLTAMSGYRPLVSMSWGSDLLVDADKSAWSRRVTRFALQHTSVLLGDCEAVRRKAQQYGFSPDRVVLFPWGVDLEQFSPGEDGGLRARLGWEDHFVLLSLRSWEPIYGIDVLVKAFALVARELPRLRLMLLGGGSQAGMIREILMKNGVMDQVYFGGQVTNEKLAGYYRACDLYLSASHSDGSSVSLMEALACGKPVLVSDIPGNLEWVESGKQGWLFKDGDMESLAEGMREAVRQQESLAEMGKASRALAEARADWRRNQLRLGEAYQMALDLYEKKYGKK